MPPSPRLVLDPGCEARAWWAQFGLLLGWPLRTIEAMVPPGKLGFGWAKFGFTSWMTLSWIDDNIWRQVVPKAWFYNVMITGVKPS